MTFGNLVKYQVVFFPKKHQCAMNNPRSRKRGRNKELDE